MQVVDKMKEQLNVDVLLRQYKGDGTSAFHLKMLLKVIVYAYTQRTFSARQIVKALRENIHYMWLSGMSRPDFRTINRFRGEIMRAVVDEVFYGVIEQLLERGYIVMKRYFVDGTKIEANANRYSFVWRKSMEKNKGKLREKVRTLLKEIDELEAEEERHYGDNDLEELGEGKELNAEELKEAARRISERLKKTPGDKKLKGTARFREGLHSTGEKYEEQGKKFRGRNSYSKTDEDAIFMRMKKDPMCNGQLKAGYNIQMGTKKQFILGYSTHQRAEDPGCL